MTALVRAWPIASFVGLTFVIALAPFAVVLARGVDPFDDPASMPLLLLMVWSPNIAAAVVSGIEGTFRQTFGALLRGSPDIAAWALALVPLGVIAVAALGRPPTEELPASSIALLIGFNLFLGPLGEEVGWRGFLLPRLLPLYGTLGAALVVGAIWAIWHAPLWFIDSPQSKMSFVVFFATVLCFSVILTAIWLASEGSLWPVVAFHLAANVTVAWAELTGRIDAADAYTAALPWYAAAAALAAAWAWWRTPTVCSA